MRTFSIPPGLAHRIMRTAVFVSMCFVLAACDRPIPDNAAVRVTRELMTKLGGTAIETDDTLAQFDVRAKALGCTRDIAIGGGGDALISVHRGDAHENLKLIGPPINAYTNFTCVPSKEVIGVGVRFYELTQVPGSYTYKGRPLRRNLVTFTTLYLLPK